MSRRSPPTRKTTFGIIYLKRCCNMLGPLCPLATRLPKNTLILYVRSGQTRRRKWMDWRTRYLSGEGGSSPAKIQKPLGEQMDELGQGTDRLRSYVAALRAGDEKWMGSICAELRALVCWADKKNQNAGTDPPKPGGKRAARVY